MHGYLFIDRSSDIDRLPDMYNSMNELRSPTLLTLIDPFAMASQRCCEAALNISEIAVSPIVDLVCGTYAEAFVSMHTFTASVALSILGDINPLSLQSVEVKSGLHRLMIIQEKLRFGSILATQALEIQKVCQGL